MRVPKTFLKFSKEAQGKGQKNLSYGYSFFDD